MEGCPLIYNMIEEELTSGFVGPYDTIHSYHITEVQTDMDGTGFCKVWSFCFGRKSSSASIISPGHPSCWQNSLNLAAFGWLIFRCIFHTQLCSSGFTARSRRPCLSATRSTTRRNSGDDMSRLPPGPSAGGVDLSALSIS